MAHNWLNLAIGLPYSLIPVLVAVVVSPSANAAFYIAWMLSSFLYVVPAHLSTVLFAVASSNPQAMARKLRFTLLVSILIGLPGMAVLGLGAHLALSIFGGNYAGEATLPLRLLVLAYLPTISRGPLRCGMSGCWPNFTRGCRPDDLRGAGGSSRSSGWRISRIEWSIARDSGRSCCRRGGDYTRHTPRSHRVWSSPTCHLTTRSHLITA